MADGGAEEGQEKSHDPTPRRLERAREQGDVVRSQDAQTLAAYLGLSAAVALTAGWGAVRLGEVLMAPLAHPQALADILVTGGARDMIAGFAVPILAATLPLVAMPAALILALLVAQRSIVFAPDKIHPKLSRISPIDNAKQKYGVTGLVEFAKSTVKLLAVSAVLGLVVWADLDRLASYVGRAPRMLGTLLADRFWALMIGLIVVSAAVAFFDVLWQQAELIRRNRMTHQELRDEAKQAEGDPHVKAQRRERGRQLAMNRMLLDVPKADVVITNPTHYAVALSWDRMLGGAPRCLAKGVDEIAARIRARAEAAEIPIFEDPPTARSLHATVEIGREIAPEHYRAVAAAILFADRMADKARKP